MGDIFVGFLLDSRGVQIFRGRNVEAAETLVVFSTSKQEEVSIRTLASWFLDLGVEPKIGG